MSNLQNFWRFSAEDLLKLLRTSVNGLTDREVCRRSTTRKNHRLNTTKAQNPFFLLLFQFNTPLIYLLLSAVLLSLFFRERTDAMIILTILLGSGILSFYQERKAACAVRDLLNIVKTKTWVIRSSIRQEVDSYDVVPGDIVFLSAGDRIPADCYLLEAKELHVDESILTGETFPAEKIPGIVKKDERLSERTNTLFMGTHVVSGSATAVVVHTGKETEFGQISEKLSYRSKENSFEFGVRRFGYFLLEITLMLVLLIFIFNMYFGRTFVESLLFALALAVGLTPQLLPAIISINLSLGAKQMAKEKVIVKKLAAIENFGGMDLLCVDKTGTLTQGKMGLTKAVNMQGTEDAKVAFWGYLNAFFQSGYTNPIDEALLKIDTINITGWRKLDEIPFDFIRKRLSVLVASEEGEWMITKGAFSQMLEVCRDVEGAEALFSEYMEQGYRVIAIAVKKMHGASLVRREDEKEMTLLGFLLFSDPPKENIVQTIDELKQLGIKLKMITGDHRLAAVHFAKILGIPSDEIVLGLDLHKISDTALLHLVGKTTIFAEVEPNQKERIILALRKRGHVVGFLGDGINDVTALHAADVSISVNMAVDIAKEASDIILLDKDLSVLKTGVIGGRKTFANTIKYIFMATSANFGNMFSMAGASLFLPFLPLLPKQILLTNLMTDFPEMTIATDRVDAEMLKKPLKWDLFAIRRFMLVFGLVSSVFDCITFLGLLFIFHAPIATFRTAWFIESVLSATAIVLVIRTMKPFFRSKPSRYLAMTVFFVMLAASILPFTPLALMLGLEALSAPYFVFIGSVLIAYIFSVECIKRWFYSVHKKPFSM